MKAYKLLTQDMRSKYGNIQWKLGERVEVDRSMPLKLCCHGIHVYCNPVLAFVRNINDANINKPRLFECDVEGDVLPNQTKSVHYSCTLISEITDFIEPTIIQKIAFGIYCALKVYSNQNFIKWANNWLNNTDRTTATAAAAYAAAYAATAATYAAATAATAATYAAATAAIYAADAAIYAADAAATIKEFNLDFNIIANKALLIK